MPHGKRDTVPCNVPCIGQVPRKSHTIPRKTRGIVDKKVSVLRVSDPTRLAYMGYPSQSTLRESHAIPRNPAQSTWDFQTNTHKSHKQTWDFLSRMADMTVQFSSAAARSASDQVSARQVSHQGIIEYIDEFLPKHFLRTISPKFLPRRRRVSSRGLSAVADGAPK